MPRWHDEHQFVEEPGCDAFLAEPERMSSNDPEIHLIPANTLLDECGVVYAQAQCHAGISLLECRDDAREHIDPGRRARADDQRTALELAQVHGLRSGPEAAGLGHGQEHLELPKGGLHKTNLMGLIKTSDWSLCKGPGILSGVDVLRFEAGIRLAAFVAVFVLLAAGEALIPRRARAVARRWRWRTNISLVVLNTLVIRLALPVTAVGMAVIAEQRGWGLLHALGAMPAVLSIAIAVVLLDLAIYLQHVLFHAVPILWRVHRMHHADIDVDVTTGARFHPVEIFLSMCLKLASISALGASPLAVLLFEALLNVGSMFNHANLRLPPG